MTKPRIIVPISLQFSIRYLLRTGLLERMNAFCDPVILLAWKDPVLERELSSVGEVHSMAPSQWGGNYERARGVLNSWHQGQLATPSTRIRTRRANLERTLTDRVRRRFRLAARDLASSWPGAIGGLRQKELDLLWTDTNAKQVRREVQRLRPDGVFCATPFIADEEMTVRVCALEGMPTCAAILSFDNITTRNWMPMTFDSYLLWNRFNAEQLLRGYPETRERQITIVGSPQFDFYWDSRYLMNEQDWRRQLKLPENRPVILFGGGYYTCAPHEPQFLQHLDQAIEQGEIPGNPVILFRRHPVDPIARWEPILRQAKHVVADNPWELGSKILGHTNVLDEDIAKLASTLCHTVAHVNVASTMTIDGAIFDRPQIGPAYDESPGRKYHRAAYECYQQEHFVPILDAGGLTVARSRRELIDGVISAILNPAQKSEGRKRIVADICTFSDGKSTGRVADAFRDFIGKTVQPKLGNELGTLAH